MAKALAVLQATPNVVAISGDGGGFVHYAAELRERTKLPSFSCAMLQASYIAAVYAPEEHVIVLAADGATLRLRAEQRWQRRERGWR